MSALGLACMRGDVFESVISRSTMEGSVRRSAELTAAFAMGDVGWTRCKENFACLDHCAEAAEIIEESFPFGDDGFVAALLLELLLTELDDCCDTSSC